MATVARAPIAALPNVSMSQSGLMVAALVGGFIVYLAMQGKLGAYWTLMTGGGGSATATTTGATTTGSGGSTAVAAPSNTSLGLPATTSVVPGLNNLPGLSTPFTAATGGVSTPTGTGIVGLPNISIPQFFGLQ